MKRLMFLVLALAMSVTVANATTAPIPWLDLIDKAYQTYEDPYRDLKPEQLQALITIFQLRQRMDRVTEEDRAYIESRLSKRETELTDAGVDIDWMISQRWVVAERRRKAATTGNTELDGEQITIAGYTIPAPADEDGAQYVYHIFVVGRRSNLCGDFDIYGYR